MLLSKSRIPLGIVEPGCKNTDAGEGILTTVVHYPTMVLKSTLVGFAQMDGVVAEIAGWSKEMGPGECSDEYPDSEGIFSALVLYSTTAAER